MSYNEINNPNPFYTKPIAEIKSFIKWSYNTHNLQPINTQDTIKTLLLVLQNIHIKNTNKPIYTPINTPINFYKNTPLIENILTNIIYGNYDFININKSIQDNLDNIKLSFTTN